MSKHSFIKILLSFAIAVLLGLVFALGYASYHHPNPMVSDKALTQYTVMDYNFRKMLNLCEATSYYSAQTACVVAYLKTNNDYHCNEGLCCGGNSIGWFECF